VSDRNFASTLNPGTVLGGKYVVRSKLGGGGMGQIFLALQKPINRPVAVKMLHPRYVSDDEVRSRFLREARAASQLAHPNTITIYDFGRAGDDLHFIAMEYVEGMSLESLVEEEGTLPVERVVPLVVQVAQSLGEAHGKGIIHRDLKPDNIMITGVGTKKERVKVLDFGIAKLTDHTKGLTDTGSVFGTPGYMAPEQAKSGEVDHTCDFYALTCCLYQALTGETPYGGSSPFEIMMKHQTSPVPSLGEGFPEGLDAFVESGMAKEAADRPQSADTYIAGLMGAFVDEEQSEGSLEGKASGTEAGTPAISSDELVTETARGIQSPFRGGEQPDYETEEEFGIQEMEVVSESDELEDAEIEAIADGVGTVGEESSPAAEGKTAEVSGPQPDAERDESILRVDSDVDPVSTTPDAASMRGRSSESGEPGGETGEGGAEAAASDEVDRAPGSEGEASEEDEWSDPSGAGSSRTGGREVGVAAVAVLAVAALGTVGYQLATAGSGEETTGSGGAAAEVSLQIDSRPEGAAVYLEGREVGVTPMAVSVSRDDGVDLELRKRGYETKRFRGLEPEEQPGGRVFASLDRKVVELRVRSPIPRSEVFLGGESRGVLPAGRARQLRVEWPTSELTVTIDPPDYRALTRRFPVSSVREEMEIAPAESQFVREATAPDASAAE